MVGPVNCCCSSWWRIRKVKEEKKYITQPGEYLKKLRVEVQEGSEANNLRPTPLVIPVPVTFPFVGSSRCRVKITSHDISPVVANPEEGDEHDDTNAEEGLEMIVSEHVSDPGGWKPDFWASPELKRSCSDLAMTSMYRELDDRLPTLTSKSYKEKLRSSTELYGRRILVGEDGTSPVSVRTRCSADNVILKKHSSSQILPSGSRKLWWKLFLWSHRNLHRIGRAKPQPVLSTLNKEGGYFSDSMEPTQAVCSRKLRDKMDDHRWDGFYGGSGMWPQKQWVAFPVDSSPLERVSEWIAESSKHPPSQGDNENVNVGDSLVMAMSPENSRDLFRLTQQPEEVLQAKNVIRSLNANSAVAYITGLGLKVIPLISHFISLRAVHLAGNFIAQIAPGSLPKGLHILNLSKNKISTIEGLRELTHLRILDLSYNRISSIGQGLSNCTLIKELSLAGNKISSVEGLHRLLKLTVLDMSFNRIATAKALGQLVANYNTLMAVNLLGNPIQSNTSNDQLRKTVCGLLPKLALLNRQPVNPQKAREIICARGALGGGGSSSRRLISQRKAMKRVVNVGSWTSNSSPHAVRRSSHAGTSVPKIKRRS